MDVPPSGCHSISGSGRRDLVVPSTASTPSSPKPEYKKLLQMFNSEKLFKGYAVGGFKRESVAIKELRSPEEVSAVTYIYDLASHFLTVFMCVMIDCTERIDLRSG